MTAPLCFLDTETTGVHPDRQVWEFAAIRREPNGNTDTWTFMISDVDLSNADPFGLKVGRFYERHPDYADQHAPLKTMAEAARIVEEVTRGAHLVGAVPNFDAEVLDRLLRSYGLMPAWHYHLLDVEALAVGWLHARAGNGSYDANTAGRIRATATPPYDSEMLSRACGVEPPGEGLRHTAYGDADWARRLYDAITAGGA
jgi:hypothetical protein